MNLHQAMREARHRSKYDRLHRYALFHEAAGYVVIKCSWFPVDAICYYLDGYLLIVGNKS